MSDIIQIAGTSKVVLSVNSVIGLVERIDRTLILLKHGHVLEVNETFVEVRRKMLESGALMAG